MAKDVTKSMIEPLVEFDDLVEDRSKNIIKVIGVGGGGCNAVRNMYDEGIEGVTFAVCNTDSQALSGSTVPVKILLGHGLGAGANPKVGREEAESNIEDIKRLLDDGTQMVFVTAGMGGGTGTGAAPVVAGIAKQRGILTVGVVTIPFYFEKKRKIIKALRGVDELRKNVDALLIVNNERLCDVYGDSDITIKEAFKRADNILKDAVKGISELITVHSDGNVNLDFRDVETTMRDGGGAIMAMGRARGEFRVENAIMDALDSPLLYGNDIGKAKRILFNIYSSDDAPIFVREMQEIDDFFDLLDPNIDVIWGTSTDDSLGEDVKVTILATGMEDDIRTENRPKSPYEEDNEFYEELIPKLYKPVKKALLQIHQKNEDNTTEAKEDTVNDVDFVVEQTPTDEPAKPNAEDSAPKISEKGPEDDETIAETVEPVQKEHVEQSAEEPKETAQDSAADADKPEVEESAPQKHDGSVKGPSIMDKWRSWLVRKAEDMMFVNDE